MLCFRDLCYLLCASLLATAMAVNANQIIASFLNDLSLPPASKDIIQYKLLSNANVLESAFADAGKKSPVLLELACFTAHIALGGNAVDLLSNQTEAQGTWSSTCWENPSCVVMPSSDWEVSLVIKIVTFFQARFSVRSAGHSPNPGWSSIGQTGILIDLQRINDITVSKDSTVVSLGPGNRWGTVYSALDPYKVTVIGGRINDVGVGGLILGGGYFHLSREYGLAADNVKNFHIVLADGTVTDANAGENSDLFWALKGGGANFGIVTRYDLYTIPVYNIWYEVFAYSPNQVPDVLDAFADWQKNGASDVKSTVAMVISLDTVTVGLLYSEPISQAPAAFSSFYNIKPAQSLLPGVNGTVTTLMTMFGNSGSTAIERHDYRSASSQVDKELYKEIYAFWADQATKVRKQTGANQTFVLQPVSTSLIDASNSRGGNPLGLPREDMQWWTTLIDWNDPADDDLVRGVSIATSKKWQSLGNARGSGSQFIYLNDASRDQNPLRTYEPRNLARLKTIAQKYDPFEVFQRLQNNGFLLSKS